MTKQTRRKFSADFKAKVALEAIKNQKTIAQLSQQYDINPITISKWKATFLERMSGIFDANTETPVKDTSVELDMLYAQIGKLKLENDFLKKSAAKLGIPASEWK